MATNGKCCCSGNETDQEIIKRIDGVISQYKDIPGALIPVLQIAQTMLGYLPEPVLKQISEKMNKPFSEVTGIVSFYSFFSTVPRGKYLVRVCLGTACYVRGGMEILNAMQKELGIKVGECTEDKLFSLEVARCFGACGMAPVIMINDDIHQRVKPVRLGQILDQYREREKKATRNADVA